MSGKGKKRKRSAKEAVKPLAKKAKTASSSKKASAAASLRGGITKRAPRRSSADILEERQYKLLHKDFGDRAVVPGKPGVKTKDVIPVSIDFKPPRGDIEPGRVDIWSPLPVSVYSDATQARYLMYASKPGDTYTNRFRPVVLNYISPGTRSWEREGDLIYMKSLDVSYQINPVTPRASDDEYGNQNGRVLIVYDKDPAPTATTVVLNQENSTVFDVLSNIDYSNNNGTASLPDFANAWTGSPNRFTEKSRFVILYDSRPALPCYRCNTSTQPKWSVGAPVEATRTNFSANLSLDFTKLTTHGKGLVTQYRRPEVADPNLSIFSYGKLLFLYGSTAQPTASSGSTYDTFTDVGYRMTYNFTLRFDRDVKIA